MLVTGAAGLVGQTVAAGLAAEGPAVRAHDIRPLAEVNAERAAAMAEVQQGDLADMEGALEARERVPMGGGPRGEALEFSARGDLMVACYPGEGTAHGVHIDNSDGAPIESRLSAKLVSSRTPCVHDQRHVMPRGTSSVQATGDRGATLGGCSS